jgi:hypothetical protein
LCKSSITYCPLGFRSKRHDRHHGVFKGLTRHDVPWLDVLFQQQLDRLARPKAFFLFSGIFRWGGRAVGQGHAHRFDRGRHRIRGVHAAARACARTRVLDDVEAFVFVDRFREELAIRLECRHDIQLLSLASDTGANRSAVDHQRRTIEPAHRDHAARHVLIASGNRDVRIVPLRAHHGFDRVGDQVARLKGVTHPVRAHRNPVGHADGVEPHADQARIDDPALYDSSEVVEVHVAAVALVPYRRDANLRLVHVGTRETGRVQHRLGCALRRRLGNSAAVLVEFSAHWGCGV